MIFDSVKHVDNYQGLGKVYEALKLIATTDFTDMAGGRHEVNDDMYFLVQEYDTFDNTAGEAHAKYIDVQYMLSGVEIMGVAPLECEKTEVEANPEADYWLYHCDTQSLKLSPGEFVVLYPNDIHKPCCIADAPCACRKIVVKVKI